MEFERLEDGTFRIELSRYNLEVLLTKLDDPSSVRTLTKVGKTGEVLAVVAVVDNAEHYSERPPGRVHLDHDPGWQNTEGI